MFPAPKEIMEGHLYMPFVHWLPKNKWREWLISVYVPTGREPHWSELEGQSVRDKSATYYAYSVDHTFYRSAREIREIFRATGFGTSFEAINHPRITRLLGC